MTSLPAMMRLRRIGLYACECNFWVAHAVLLMTQMMQSCEDEPEYMFQLERYS
jgi:hypothetical protein